MTLMSAHPARLENDVNSPLRVLFALPGLHRVSRGAEVAFEEIASRLALIDGFEVTLAGSGRPKPETPYRFLHVGCKERETFERWPKFPGLRDEYMYEELSFAPRLWRALRDETFDVTITCGYPYSNWVLRRQRRRDGSRHIFVTQNGDWMVQSNDWEYRYFDCDGLVCTNPIYLERSAGRYPNTLIPNGVDTSRFFPGRGDATQFGLRNDLPVVLIVSALIESKRVLEGIDAVSRIPDVQLLVAGAGKLREAVEERGREMLGDRFRLVSLQKADMPATYRAATALLHMSVDEPFGNVYLEALASGLPVVCHDQPSTRWMLEDQATFVDTNQLSAVADAVSAAIGLAGGQTYEAKLDLINRRFRWEQIAEQYGQFCRELVRSSQGQS